MGAQGYLLAYLPLIESAASRLPACAAARWKLSQPWDERWFVIDFWMYQRLSLLFKTYHRFSRHQFRHVLTL
jgi:hypothetical protein